MFKVRGKRLEEIQMRGLRFMDYGLWFTVYGLWFMVYGWGFLLTINSKL